MVEVPQHEQPAILAAAGVDRVVAELVDRAEGPGGFADVPAYPGASYTRRVPRPVPSLRAALLVRTVAASRVRDAIRNARAAGESWAELAELLGVADAEAAYEVAVGPADDGAGWAWSRHRDTYWRCSTCGALVTDAGPYGHPSDNESGHADGCARHRADIAAYLVRWNEP